MRYRLNKVEIIDPASPWHRQVKDIIVDNGIIREAEGPEDEDTMTIDAQGLAVIPGLCETYASVGDPGHEYREDLESLAEAAAAGGVTAVCAIADNDPVTQHKTHVEYLSRKTRGKAVEVWPLGAITEGLKGRNPTEMFDMHYAGAVAYTDAPYPVANAGVMLRALQYVTPFNGVVFSVPYNASLAEDGQVNEGLVSVKMGMKGIPHLAESLQIHRDLQLLEYGGGRLHFTGVTTEDGIGQIRQAKAKGLQVTAAAYLHHLLFDDSTVAGFDTNYKVMPPLRTAKDIAALHEGLADGTIDMISAQHVPLDTESKRLEFEYATPGMANIEFAFAVALKALGTVEKVVQLYSLNPRKLLRQPEVSVQSGMPANLALVDLSAEFVPAANRRKSKSGNSPFYGQPLKGKVRAVFNNNQVIWNE